MSQRERYWLRNIKSHGGKHNLLHVGLDHELLVFEADSEIKLYRLNIGQVDSLSSVLLMVAFYPAIYQEN